MTEFNTAEIDGLIIGPAEQDDEADLLPQFDPDAPTLAAPGDLWQLGAHCPLCGDATAPLSFRKLPDGEAAQMVLAKVLGPEARALVQCQALLRFVPQTTV